MEKGDIIKIRYLAEAIPARVDQVDRYSGAYIIAYTILASGKGAMAAVFPDLPYLPPFTTDPYYYSPPAAFIETGENIWPVPMGKRSKGGIATHLININPIVFMKLKIDYIYRLVHDSNMTGDMIITPGTNGEVKLHNKWWR